MLDLLHGLGAGLETLLEAVSGHAWLAFALVTLVAAATLLGALLLAHHWRRLAARIGLRLRPPGTR